MDEIIPIQQQQEREAEAFYKELRRIVGRNGIRDTLEMLALIASDFGEGESHIEGEDSRLPPDAAWLAIAASISQCSDMVNLILDAEEGDRL